VYTLDAFRIIKRKYVKLFINYMNKRNTKKKIIHMMYIIDRKGNNNVRSASENNKCSIQS
jgi:hypothetical protein